jgi:hypothetical protein
MVELGFVAVASLVQTWDGAEPDEDDGKALANWKNECATVANTFSELLQLAWRCLQRSVNPFVSCFNILSENSYLWEGKNKMRSILLFTERM